MTSREEALEDIGVEVLKFAEWYRTLHDGPDMIKGGLLLNTSEAIYDIKERK